MGISFHVSASPDGGKDWENEEEIPPGEVALPAWEEGSCGDHFDTRIWPDGILLWLEQENIRAIIGDPETSAKERRELQRILALQNAWRMHS